MDVSNENVRKIITFNFNVKIFFNLIVLPERMQQVMGWGILGFFVYLVQLVGFDGGAQDRHGTQLHSAALRGNYWELAKMLNI